MKDFKERWQIQRNWQLIFPLLGVLGTIYLAYRLTIAILNEVHIVLIVLATILCSYALLKFFLWWFKKLEKKWIVTYRWEMIRIFIVFAITGSSAAFISKPILLFLGITKENLNPFAYWVLYCIIGLIFYQMLLISIGWLFGQFKFFWEFEKKLFRRMGLKRDKH